MFSPSSPSQAYSKVSVDNGVMTASPHKLIQMLFDGALLAVADARSSMSKREVAKKGAAISRAIEIISNGLKASLDFNTGGDLAERLGSLYDYMCDRLFHANLHNDAAALQEVSTLLTELKSAWEEIADDPAVLSQNRDAA